jgi:hypothetical protein
MRRDIYTQWRSALIAVGAGAAFVVILSVLTLWQGEGGRFHQVLFPLLFIPGGYLLASRAFSDLHKKESIQNFLLLPAGSLEKTLSRLLFAGPGYVLLGAAAYTAASLAAYPLTTLIFKASIPPFNPFSGEALGIYGHYLITQSMFFLGAAWFRRNNFFKTVLILAALGFAAALWAIISFRIVYWDYFTGFFKADLNMYFNFNSFETMPGLSFRALKTLEISGNIFYRALLAPFCWIIAWMRVREAEVHHGV